MSWPHPTPTPANEIRHVVYAVWEDYVINGEHKMRLDSVWLTHEDAQARIVDGSRPDRMLSGKVAYLMQELK